LTPSVGLHYIHHSSPTVTESGAGDANLIIHAHRYNSLRVPIGARLSRECSFGGGMVWTPEVRAFYICELADASVRVGTSFAAAPGVPFYSESGDWGRNSGRFGAGLGVQLTDWLKFRVDYDHEVYTHTSANWFGTSLGVRF
jgi:outer membrane autotransporter protein